MTQQMIKPSYYILEGSSFVANLKMGGVMTLVEQFVVIRGGVYTPLEGCRWWWPREGCYDIIDDQELFIYTSWNKFCC